MATGPNTCCGCFSAERGIQIIGWLGVVGTVINIFTVPIKNSSCTGCMLATVESTAITVTLIIGLIINIFLILGVKKGRSIYLVPWICTNVSTQIIILPIIAALPTFPGITAGEIAVGEIIVMVMLFPLFYFLRVVWTHYETLRRREFELLYNIRDVHNYNVYSPTAPSAV